MPIHDWTRVNAGLFHHFHQRWIAALCDALNAGILPTGYYALSEQITGGIIPDVLTLHTLSGDSSSCAGGLALAEAPPKVSYVVRAEADQYAAAANRISIRHPLGEVVAVIEIVSPGNKDNRAALRSFVEKAADLVRRGVHLLVVDLFPPTSRDPQGIHKAIWDEIHEDPFELPLNKPLTLAAYCAGIVKTAYVETVAVGDCLPDMPLFLSAETYIPAPLAATYETTWRTCPKPLQTAVAG